MQKLLLLILICLFVSFEVKSKEIILSCKIEYQLIKTDKMSGDDEIKDPKWEKTILPFNFYLDLKDKWIGLHRRGYYKNLSKSNFQEEGLYITHFIWTEDQYGHSHMTIQIQRFNGIFIFTEKDWVYSDFKEQKQSKLIQDRTFRGICENTSK